MTLEYTIPSRSIARHPAMGFVATLAGAAVLVGCGKMNVAIGKSLHLPEACWQLLALRSFEIAAVVAGLIRLRLDHLWLLGLAYGAYLATTHGGMPLFYAATAAGIGASLLRTFAPKLTWLPTLALLFGLLVPGVAKKLAAGNVQQAFVEVAIRAIVAVMVLRAVRVTGVPPVSGSLAKSPP